MNASTSDGGIPTCKLYGEKGHLESECWKKHGKPEKEMYLRKCWVCGSTEHVKNDCPKHKNKGDNGDAVNNEASMNGIFLGMALWGDIIRYFNMGCLKSRNIIFIFISDTVTYLL